MGRTETIQTGFAAGRYHELLKNRDDLEGFYQAVLESSRMTLLAHGGAATDGGFAWNAATKDDDVTPVNLIDWRFSNNSQQCYTLEFGDRTIRFQWQYDRGLIRETTPSHAEFTGTGLNDATASGTYTGDRPVVFKVVISGEGTPDTIQFYANGNLEGGPAGLDGTPIELSFGAQSTGVYINLAETTGHTAGDYWEFYAGFPYEVATPYDGDDVGDLWTEQRGDVMYIYHNKYPIHKLIRNDHDDWTLRVVEWSEARFLGRSSGVRCKVFDTSNNGTYTGPTTPSQFDHKFSEDSGSVLLADSAHTGTIAWSSLAGYYDSVPNYISTLVPTLQQFAVEYYGSVFIPEAGDYRFAINAGFGGDLYIDGDLVVNWVGVHSQFNPNDASAQTNYAAHSGKVTLSEGEHTFKVRMYNTNSTQTYGIALTWLKPGDSEYAVIPADYFVKRQESASVEHASYTIYDLDGVSIPTDSGEMDEACDSDTEGVTVRASGIYDDRINFHSNADAPVMGFEADGVTIPLPNGSDFTVQIDGWIYVPEDGSYNFALDSNDAADFCMHNGDPDSPITNTLIQWHGAHGCATTGDGYDQDGWDQHPSGLATLSNQWYQFRVRLANTGYGFGLSIAWKTPSSPSTWIPIPRANMTPGREDGYPYIGKFYEGRHWLFRDLTVYATKSGQAEDLTVGADAGDGMEFDLDTERVDLIQAVATTKGGLLAFTSGGVLNINSGGQGPITPEDKRQEEEASTGSAAIAPAKIGNSIFYVGKEKETIYELKYSRDRNAHYADDVTVMSMPFTDDTIVKIGIQRKGKISYERISIDLLWALTESGNLWAMTYDEANNVYAWHEHPLGADVQSFCITPGLNGDELNIAVKREEAARSLETLHPDRCLDCSVSFSDTIEITAEHLASQEITVRYGDDKDNIAGWEKTTLDADGKATLDLDETPAYLEAGLAFDWSVTPMPLEKRYASGATTQGRLKRWIEIGLQVRNTGGTITAQRQNGSLTYTLLSDETTLKNEELVANLLDYDKEAIVVITGSDPMPATILSLRGKVEIQ